MGNDSLGMLGSILAYLAFFAVIYVLFGIARRLDTLTHSLRTSDMGNDSLGMLGSILAYLALFAAIYVLFGIG